MDTEILVNALREAAARLEFAEEMKELRMDPDRVKRALAAIPEWRKEVSQHVRDVRYRFLPFALLEFAEMILRGREVLPSVDMAEKIFELVNELYVGKKA